MARKSSSRKPKPSGTHRPNQFQIVTSVTSSPITPASSLALPHGWTVEKRRRRRSSKRSAASHHDTYYYEPGTGRQFRSMISIQRYLNGETILECRPKSIKCRSMQIVPRSLIRSGTEFNLPEGWLVEEHPRKNINHTGQIDRYYIEPETKKRFRSLLSAERYVAARKEYAAGQKEKAQEDEPTMQIVPCGRRSGTDFNLPEGWLVEEQPRKNVNYIGYIDRYYIEPETKKRFRSLLSAERYVAERMEYAAGQKEKTQEDQSTMQIVPRGLKSGTEFNLPEGWLVEEDPRKNVNYAGRIDRYYIEPETKKRFRSLLSAERYVAKEYAAGQKEKQEDESTDIELLGQSCDMTIKIKHLIRAKKYKSIRALDAGCACVPFDGSCSERDEHSGKQAKNSAPRLSSPPPDKISWVLDGLGGNVWSPVIDGSPVSKSITQKWSETFFLTLDDRM